MTDNLEALVAEIEAGLAGVTAGPWAAYMDDFTVRVDDRFIPAQRKIALCATGDGAGKNAAHFARLSPENVRAILEDRRSLQGEVERLRKALEFADRQTEKVEALLEPHVEWVPAGIRELVERNADYDDSAGVSTRMGDLRAVVSASEKAESTRPGAVVVKPLEWASEPPYSVARVPLLLMHYATECVWDQGRFRYCILSGSHVNQQFATLAEAKAAAQSDCERRILSAIELKPVAGAVTEAMVDAEQIVFDVIWPQQEWNGDEAFCREVAAKVVRCLLAFSPRAHWPNERVNIPEPSNTHCRIVGFRIREGDEAWGEFGLSEPLSWLRRMIDHSALEAALQSSGGTAGEPPAQPAGEGEAAKEWRCFHCDEAFTSEYEARLHFGRDETKEPACCIKAGAEHSMLVALRRAEADAADAWFKLQNESGEAAQAYFAQSSRHQEQLRTAEELGYERGLAAARKHPETLGLAPITTPQAPVALVEGERLKPSAFRKSRPDLDFNDPNQHAAIGLAYGLSTPPPPANAGEREGWRSIPVTDETVEYVSRYGGRCRDCADNFGTCPGTNLPCVPAEANKAIRHVLNAINYGFEHGFLPIPAKEG